MSIKTLKNEFFKNDVLLNEEEILKESHAFITSNKGILNDIILDRASNSLDVQFSDDSKFFLNCSAVLAANKSI